MYAAPPGVRTNANLHTVEGNPSQQDTRTVENDSLNPRKIGVSTLVARRFLRRRDRILGQVEYGPAHPSAAPHPATTPWEAEDENRTGDAKCTRFLTLFGGGIIPIPTLHPFPLSPQVSRAVLLRPHCQVRVLVLRRLAAVRVPERQDEWRHEVWLIESSDCSGPSPYTGFAFSSLGCLGCSRHAGSTQGNSYGAKTRSIDSRSQTSWYARKYRVEGSTWV